MRAVPSKTVVSSLFAPRTLRRVRGANNNKPGFFVTRSVSEEVHVFPSLTLRVTVAQCLQIYTQFNYFTTYPRTLRQSLESSGIGRLEARRVIVNNHPASVNTPKDEREVAPNVVGVSRQMPFTQNESRRIT